MRNDFVTEEKVYLQVVTVLEGIKEAVCGTLAMPDKKIDEAFGVIIEKIGHLGFVPDMFEKSMAVFKIYYKMIEQDFDMIYSHELSTSDDMIVRNLQAKVRNALVTGVNISGTNPYYGRDENLSEFRNSKKSWAVHLNDEFDRWIVYFKGL